jgi:hypothetical protein
VCMLVNSSFRKTTLASESAGPRFSLLRIMAEEDLAVVLEVMEWQGKGGNQTGIAALKEAVRLRQTMSEYDQASQGLSGRRGAASRKGSLNTNERRTKHPSMP